RQRLRRRALARAHRAVHVAAPVVRGLGAGPVDLSQRLADRRAEVDQRSGRQYADRAAARVRVGRPVLLAEVLQVCGLVPEVLDEVVDACLLPVLDRARRPLARLAAAAEAEDDAGLAVLRRRVDRQLAPPDVRERLAGEAAVP